MPKLLQVENIVKISPQRRSKPTRTGVSYVVCALHARLPWRRSKLRSFSFLFGSALWIQHNKLLTCVTDLAARTSLKSALRCYTCLCCPLVVVHLAANELQSRRLIPVHTLSRVCVVVNLAHFHDQSVTSVSRGQRRRDQSCLDQCETWTRWSVYDWQSDVWTTVSSYGCTPYIETKWGQEGTDRGGGKTSKEGGEERNVVEEGCEEGGEKRRQTWRKKRTREETGVIDQIIE